MRFGANIRSCFRLTLLPYVDRGCLILLVSGDEFMVLLLGTSRRISDSVTLQGGTFPRFLGRDIKTPETSCHTLCRSSETQYLESYRIIKPSVDHSRNLRGSKPTVSVSGPRSPTPQHQPVAERQFALGSTGQCQAKRSDTEHEACPTSKKGETR